MGAGRRARHSWPRQTSRRRARDLRRRQLRRTALMVQLIAYAAIAAVALGAIYGFDKSRQNIGRDAQRALDAPVLEQCKAMNAPKPADCAVAIRVLIDN